MWLKFRNFGRRGNKEINEQSALKEKRQFITVRFLSKGGEKGQISEKKKPEVNAEFSKLPRIDKGLK